MASTNIDSENLEAVERIAFTNFPVFLVTEMRGNVVDPRIGTEILYAFFAVPEAAGKVGA